MINFWFFSKSSYKFWCYTWNNSETLLIKYSFSYLLILKFLSSYTALHYAVERADEDLVNFLTQCPKIDLEALNYRGRTALEVSPMVPTHVMQLLRARGVPSPYISDSEDDLDDSDDQVGTFFKYFTHLRK